MGGIYWTLFFIFILIQYGTTTDKREFSLIESTICDTEENLIVHECLEPRAMTRGLLDCFTTHCIDEDSCLGVVSLKNNTCLSLTQCDYILGKTVVCKDNEPHVKVYRKVCKNNGTFFHTGGICNCNDGYVGPYCEIRDIQLQKKCQNNGKLSKTPGRICDCKNSYVGPHCERRGKDCFELYEAGYRGTKNYWLLINGETVRVKCKYPPSYPNQIFVVWMDSTGRYNFNRSWYDYKYGYEFDEENKLLGFDYLHVFTNQREAQLRLVLKIYPPDGSWYYYTHYYENFTLKDETYLYSYSYVSSKKVSNTISSYEPFKDFRAGNCFNMKNVPFSTVDYDNDKTPNENCASHAGSGWWFNDCLTSCNLLGIAPQNLSPNPTSGYFTFLNIDTLSSSFNVTYKMRLEVKFNIV